MYNNIEDLRKGDVFCIKDDLQRHRYEIVDKDNFKDEHGKLWPTKQHKGMKVILIFDYKLGMIVNLDQL